VNITSLRRSSIFMEFWDFGRCQGGVEWGREVDVAVSVTAASIGSAAISEMTKVVTRRAERQSPRLLVLSGAQRPHPAAPSLGVAYAIAGPRKLLVEAGCI